MKRFERSELSSRAEFIMFDEVWDMIIL